ncbi:Efhb [Acrasis kona]|uniref:Efhb n=1 Tax=Acrasis kona TaxID=1008807 RepID=A0AAW2YJH2_9EUKA
MNNTGTLKIQNAKVRDHFPHITTYGRKTPANEYGVMTALNEEYPQKPNTPDMLKKFRQSNHEVGKTSKHWGLAEEEIPKMTHGRQTEQSEAAGELVNPSIKSPVQEYFNEKEEAVYASKLKEPLGKSLSRGHVLPGYAKSSDFRFGRATKVEESSKELIFPRNDVYHLDENAHQLYVQTHKSYNPGEQVKRYQEGLPVDALDHRFGKVEGKERDGVKKSLHPDITDKKSGFNSEPAIINQIQQNFVQFNRDPLGKSRHHVLTMNDLPEKVLQKDHTFGVATKSDTWGASECMKGSYSADEQMPDKDLGMSTRALSPYDKVDHDSSRIYGCPTIRYDIRAPRNRSISDNNNYGNEPNAQATMYPSKYLYQGVSEDNFDTLMSRSEIKDIIMSSGCIDGEEEFDNVYDYALNMYSDEIELVRRRDRNGPKPLSPQQDSEAMTLDLFRQALAKFTIDFHQNDLQNTLKNL